jgi:TRAP-type mannitol/chloroaromatic compound transport system permease small subunit
VTPLALWAAVALVALVATAMWAILARQTGVYVTSGVSYTAWSWLALTGGDTALVNGGDPIWVRETVASLQFVALALAIISLVVFAMRLMGAYPSPQDNAAETEQSAQQSSS